MSITPIGRMKSFIAWWREVIGFDSTSYFHLDNCVHVFSHKLSWISRTKFSFFFPTCMILWNKLTSQMLRKMNNLWLNRGNLSSYALGRTNGLPSVSNTQPSIAYTKYIVWISSRILCCATSMASTMTKRTIRLLQMNRLSLRKNWLKICGIYLKLIKKDWKITTFNWLDLEH